ncbi:MAG: glycosyltransferase family 2 protein, partial [Armatimonadota bacterium]
MTTSAVVVTHNRLEALRNALRTLLSQTRELDEVVVVDNASSDSTGEMLRTEFPQVKVCAMSENVGCAVGRNRGCAAATGD